MAHVGVERLTAGDDEEDGTERQERLARLVSEVVDGVLGVDRTDDVGVVDHVAQTEQSERCEPDHHDRTEHLADRAGSLALDEEQAHEDHDGDGDDPIGEGGRDFFEALHGREHRDGWCDDAVAVEQRSSEHSEDHQRAGPLDGFTLLRHDQGGESEDAALSAVVGAHHEHQVLDRDDDDESPERQRADAVDIDLVDGHHVRLLVERLLQRIQRTGADVAVHHAEGAKGEGDSADLGVGVGLGGGHGDRGGSARARFGAVWRASGRVLPGPRGSLYRPCRWVCAGTECCGRWPGASR